MSDELNAGFDLSKHFSDYKGLSEAIKSITELYQSDAFKAMISLSKLQLEKQAEELANLYSIQQAVAMKPEVYNRIIEAISFYHSEEVFDQIKRISSAWAEAIVPSLLTAATSIDLSKYSIGENGGLSFEGVEYSREEINQELDRQVELAKEAKIPLRDKFENLKQKLWLLLLVVRLVMILPDVPEKLAFYPKLVSEIEQVLIQKAQICFTIKERSYLRDSPNSSATIVLVLKYDTPLEIIEDVPRWYYVRYSDTDGLDTLGWVSKISVETEE